MADKIEIDREVLKDAALWITKMTVDGYHKKSVFPRHAEMTLARLNAALWGNDHAESAKHAAFQPSRRQALAMAGDLETYRKGSR